MRLRPLTIAVLALTLLTGQQDLPIRAPGRFTATGAGDLTGALSGDATATRFRNGARELYLVLDSDKMMATKRMLSVSIRLPAQDAKSPFALSTANTVIRLDNLVSHDSTTLPVQGTLQYRGKDTLEGSFRLSAGTGAQTVTIIGTFKDAPVVEGIN